MYDVRKILIIALCSLFFIEGKAQDQQLLSSRDIMGTARFVGMAGAMTAVGGDPSAVIQNPAGLGVYRRLETMISFDIQLDYTRQFSESKSTFSGYFIPSQVSAVFSLINDNKTSGVIGHNFMISYNRLKNWHRTYNASAVTTADRSLAQWMERDAYRAAGGRLTHEDMNNEFWYDDADISWLTQMGYQNYMIDDPDSVGSMSSQVNPNQNMGHAIRVQESGYTNEFALNWAMNIDNRYFVGLGLGIMTMYHLRYADYAESFEDGTNMVESNYTRWNGVGVNGSIGLIAHPIRCLRIGVSFTTPSLYSMKIRNQGKMEYEATESYITPENIYKDSHFTTPLRTSVGVAYQLKDKGLVSVQYDYAHHKDMFDVHTLRVGTEWRIKEKWYLNAGYAIESMFRSTNYVYPLPHGSVRTDTDWMAFNWRQHASVAAGYRGTYLIAQVAYQCGWDKGALYAHEALDAYDMRDITHRIVLSFAFHTR